MNVRNNAEKPEKMEKKVDAPEEKGEKNAVKAFGKYFAAGAALVATLALPACGMDPMGRRTIDIDATADVSHDSPLEGIEDTSEMDGESDVPEEVDVPDVEMDVEEDTVADVEEDVVEDTGEDVSEEEGIKFTVPKGIFYNPEMKFSRSLSSLAVGAIESPIEICDSFCASGIRGIRYAKENRNVKKTIFVDIEKPAVKAVQKNAKSAKIKFRAEEGNISKLVFDIAADFLEIDPFGTPAPYLYDGFRVFNPKKTAYLSATATDVAVLCGGKTKACMKNYHSRPLNNEFTHENGLRILIKKIAETAAEFNMGIRPLVSISDRHYLKTIMEVKRGAELANESLLLIGYVGFCPSCGYREKVKFPKENCPNCRAKTDYAGPLWTGELHDAKFLERMEKLNEKRNYSQKRELGKTISLLNGETGMPPYYYNVHVLSKRFNGKYIPRIDEMVELLQKKKFKASKTHFSPISIKTTAPYKEIEKLFRIHKH